MKLLLFALSFYTFTVSAEFDDQMLAQKLNSGNLSIQGQNQSVESEKVRQGYLGRSFLPSVSLDLGQERFQTGRYKEMGNPYGFLEARFNLFRGGRDSIESSIRDLNVRIAEHNRTDSVRNQLNKVRKLQWQIIHNSELIKTLEREQKQNAVIKSHAERRAQSGVSTRSDTLEFNIYSSELEEGIESLSHENKILKIGLLPLLGLSSLSDINFQNELLHQHDDELLQKSYDAKTNPKVSSLDAEFESFELQKKSSNRWWTPSLDLYGGYYLYTLRDRDYLGQQERDDRVVGLRISFELFDGLRSHNQATSSHYQAEARRLQARFTEKETASQYLMLKEDLLHTHEVMHYVEDRIIKSKDYLKITLQEYDRGVKNSLDALIAMQRYFTYEKQYLQKKKEYQTIKADMLSLRGE